MFKIKTHKSSAKVEGNTKIIELRGSIDSFNINDVVSYIKHILNNTKENKVVFNMTELTFITAQGIGSFVNVINMYIEKKYIYIMGMNKIIKEMFNLLGFEGCCNLIDDLTDLGKRNSLFPIELICHSCGNKINIIKSGRFKCKSCKTKISINKKGKLEK